METEGQVVQHLVEGAARSGAALIAAAAAAVHGWVVLVDPVAGVLYSEPQSAASAGARAAAAAAQKSKTLDRGVTVRRVAGVSLVVSPGTTTSARRADLVTRTTAGLLHVRARRAEEIRPAEMRLHSAAARLLLQGQTDLASEIIGDLTAQALVVRLAAGPAPEKAHRAVWEAVLPLTTHPAPPALVALYDGDLAVIVMHESASDAGRVLRLLARAADQQGILGGVSDPVSLDMLASAWLQAGHARADAAVDRGLAHATGLGDRSIARIIPPDRLSAWASDLLRPLDPLRRRTLDTWLHCGSVSGTAQILGISCPTVRARLRSAGNALGADLALATTQAQLLVALRAPESTDGIDLPLADIPAHAPLHLVPDHVARDWAMRLVGDLDLAQRITVRVWLENLGSHSTVARALGLHRATLRRWLDQVADQLALDLSSPTIRAELHLAIETVAGPTESAEALPRLGGRTYPRQPPTGASELPDPQLELP
ncbi:helix-turn-helix domain-containing protein [Streptomyces halstedii]|uniref:Helix-turn-helix domain-containing protein n=1 Tax=Streptomyces halstedii TaxID=1944 RepID=A0ABS6U1V3_STRHA|nr:helix-turn-helix domain-containing protein [Streptomyces halstedii]MBV7674271.1 helix-turn-helix domain-containing protein [Streptomyces halstedii]